MFSVHFFCCLQYQVLDEENAVVQRGKGNEKATGAINKPRAVLGDISSNRLALATLMKADDNDFKKPSVSGRGGLRKTQEAEK